MKGTVFIKDAEIMILFKCVPSGRKDSHSNVPQPSYLTWLPVALVIGVAFSKAFLYMGHSEGVHKVSPAFVLLVAFSGWATGNERCIINYKNFSCVVKVFSQFLPTDAIRADCIIEPP